MAGEYETLEQMRDQVIRIVGEDGSTRRQTMVEEAINRHYMDAARRHRWAALMRLSESVNSFTAAERYLYLPKDVDQLMFILDNSKDIFPSAMSNEAFFREFLLNLTSTGQVTQWTPAGEFGRKREFASTAEKLTITPDSSEAASIDFLIHGKIGEDEVFETVSTSGSSSAESSKTYADLVSVSTNGSQTGPVSITGSTSSDEYATIAAGERTARYQRIRLGAVPDTSRTYTIGYKARVIPLTRDDQIPEIPVSQYLINKAISSSYAQQRRFASAATYHDQQAERILQSMISEELMHGEVKQQAVPALSRFRNASRIVVVNNGS